MTNDSFTANRLDEDSALFHARFWRCHGLLYFITCRVLGRSERVDDAIENCWLRASRNPPQFKYEGEFRSWLFRILIDEACAILRDSQEKITQDKFALRRDFFRVQNHWYENKLCRRKQAPKESTENVYPTISKKHRRR